MLQNSDTKKCNNNVTVYIGSYMCLVEFSIFTKFHTPRGERSELSAEKVPPVSADTWSNSHLSETIATTVPLTKCYR